MSTKTLDPKELGELQPAYGLWEFYTPEKALYHFEARIRAEAERWQRTTRRALNEIIGFQVFEGIYNFSLSTYSICTSIDRTWTISWAGPKSGQRFGGRCMGASFRSGKKRRVKVFWNSSGAKRRRPISQVRPK